MATDLFSPETTQCLNLLVAALWSQLLPRGAIGRRAIYITLSTISLFVALTDFRLNLIWNIVILICYAAIYVSTGIFCSSIARQAAKGLVLHLSNDLIQCLLPSENVTIFQQQIMENAYRLSYKFDQEKCEFCWNEFDDDPQPQSLLMCGHRYHSKCLADWEKFKLHRCALCNMEYSNRTKWDYHQYKE